MLYRGDTTATKPALTSGVWLTDDRDYAECYASTVHAYEFNGTVLDLRELGVGDDETRDALVAELIDAGISNAAAYRGGWQELYQLCERSEFRDAVRSAGFDAVCVQQWNADVSDEPSNSWMVV